MIITSDKVFVHVPKTGGTSITRELRAEGGVPNRLRGHVIPKHVTAMQIRDVMGEEEYGRRLSFAVVRNPWARMVSMYSFFLQISSGTYGFSKSEVAAVKVRARQQDGFEWFLTELPLRATGPAYWPGKGMLESQLSWFQEGGKDVVNDVFKLEDIGLGMDIENKSKHGPWEGYYNDLTDQIIRDNFMGEIERFEYKNDSDLA